MGPCFGQDRASLSGHARAIFSNSGYVLIVSATDTFLEITRFCSMDTLELCGGSLHPGGKLETPYLVRSEFLAFLLTKCDITWVS